LVADPVLATIVKRYDAYDPKNIPAGAFWGLALHPETLIELCRIREELLRDCSSPSGKMLRAIIMGALHSPLAKNEPSYFPINAREHSHRSRNMLSNSGMNES
jgi:hypothetical protein